MGLVALVAHYASALTGGVVHYFVMCLIMGAVFFALGFLEKGILNKTQSSGLITFFVTILIFSNLANTTPQQVVSVLPALLISAVCGVLGTVAGRFCLCEADAYSIQFGGFLWNQLYLRVPDHHADSAGSCRGVWTQ